jgi:hypothetical protein
MNQNDSSEEKTQSVYQVYGTLYTQLLQSLMQLFIHQFLH